MLTRYIFAGILVIVPGLSTVFGFFPASLPVQEIQNIASEPYTVRIARTVKPAIIRVCPSGDKGPCGCAVFIDSRGYAITAHHVVGGAFKVPVKLDDGKEETEAAVLGICNETDLAILQLDKDVPLDQRRHLQWPVIPILPVTKTVVPGEPIVVLGHPFGYGVSVSGGLVSGLGRHVTLPTGVTMRDMIQTDAPINPGNSGGPVLNRFGQIVGIVSCVREGADGVSFVIPPAAIRDLIEKLVPK